MKQLFLIATICFATQLFALEIHPASISKTTEKKANKKKKKEEEKEGGHTEEEMEEVGIEEEGSREEPVESEQGIEENIAIHTQEEERKKKEINDKKLFPFLLKPLILPFQKMGAFAPTKNTLHSSNISLAKKTIIPGRQGLANITEKYTIGKFAEALSYIHEDYLFESSLGPIYSTPPNLQKQGHNSLEKAFIAHAKDISHPKMFINNFLADHQDLSTDPFFPVLKGLVSFNVRRSKQNIHRLERVKAKAKRQQIRYKNNTTLQEQWEELFEKITEFEQKIHFLSLYEEEDSLHEPFQEEYEELIAITLYYKGLLLEKSPFCKSIHRVIDKGFTNYFDLLIYIQDSSYIEALMDGSKEASSPLEEEFLQTLGSL